MQICLLISSRLHPLCRLKLGWHARKNNNEKSDIQKAHSHDGVKKYLALNLGIWIDDKCLLQAMWNICCRTWSSRLSCFYPSVSGEQKSVELTVLTNMGTSSTLMQLLLFFSLCTQSDHAAQFIMIVSKLLFCFLYCCICHVLLDKVTSSLK